MPELQFNYQPRTRVFVWDEKRGVMRQPVTYAWAIKQGKRHPNRYKVLGPRKPALVEKGILDLGLFAARELIHDFFKPPEPEVKRDVTFSLELEPKTLAEEVLPEVLAAGPETAIEVDAIEEHHRTEGVKIAITREQMQEVEGMVMEKSYQGDRLTAIAKEQELKPGNRKNEKLALFIIDALGQKL